MAGIPNIFFDCDYSQQSLELIPVAKRKPAHIAWMGLFDTYMQMLHDLIFEYYANGETASPDYSGASTYLIYQRVKFTDGAIYEAIQDVPISTPPTDTDYWVKVLDTWIGFRERRKYKFQTVLMEFILNKHFDTTMSYRPTLPDIYIETNTLNNIPGVYFFNNSENQPQYIFNNAESSPFYLWNTDEYLPEYDFTVFVPVAVWTALGATAEERDAVIQWEVDKYKFASIKNNIETY